MNGKTGLWLAAIALFAAFAVLFGSGEEKHNASQTELRMAEVLGAIEGAGKVEVAVFYQEQAGGLYENTGMPTGAVVVAQGAEDLTVRLSLIRAVRTLLGLPENAVDVFVMEENGS